MTRSGTFHRCLTEVQVYKMPTPENYHKIALHNGPARDIRNSNVHSLRLASFPHLLRMRSSITHDMPIKAILSASYCVKGTNKLMGAHLSAWTLGWWRAEVLNSDIPNCFLRNPGASFNIIQLSEHHRSINFMES